jgi:hypothetical protein
LFQDLLRQRLPASLVRKLQSSIGLETRQARVGTTPAIPAIKDQGRSVLMPIGGPSQLAHDLRIYGAASRNQKEERVESSDGRAT